jgi:hypothetical protein
MVQLLVRQLRQLLRAGLGHLRALQQQASCEHPLVSSDAWLPSALGLTSAAATQRRLSGSTSSQGSAIEGPLYFYNEGIRKGTYRPDVLQQVTAEKLQVRPLTLSYILTSNQGEQYQAAARIRGQTSGQRVCVSQGNWPRKDKPLQTRRPPM